MNNEGPRTAPGHFSRALGAFDHDPSNQMYRPQTHIPPPPAPFPGVHLQPYTRGRHHSRPSTPHPQGRSGSRGRSRSSGRSGFGGSINPNHPMFQHYPVLNQYPLGGRNYHGPPPPFGQGLVPRPQEHSRSGERSQEAWRVEPFPPPAFTPPEEYPRSWRSTTTALPPPSMGGGVPIYDGPGPGPGPSLNPVFVYPSPPKNFPVNLHPFLDSRFNDYFKFDLGRSVFKCYTRYRSYDLPFSSEATRPYVAILPIRIKSRFLQQPVITFQVQTSVQGLPLTVGDVTRQIWWYFQRPLQVHQIYSLSENDQRRLRRYMERRVSNDGTPRVIDLLGHGVEPLEAWFRGLTQDGEWFNLDLYPPRQ